MHEFDADFRPESTGRAKMNPSGEPINSRGTALNSARDRRPWNWPNGAKIAISIGLALEDFQFASQYVQVPRPGKADPFSLSYGDYGWRAGIWRLLDLLDEFGIKANMSTNGLAAERRPEVVRAVADAGHEINGHGWVNDNFFGTGNVDEERAEIRRCTEALLSASGVRPVGWTGPGSSGTSDTYRLLVEEGYIWNGDDASDDLPFLRETGSGTIVILPRTNIFHNDYAMWSAGPESSRHHMGGIPRHLRRIARRRCQGFPEMDGDHLARAYGGAPHPDTDHSQVPALRTRSRRRMVRSPAATSRIGLCNGHKPAAAPSRRHNHESTGCDHPSANAESQDHRRQGHRYPLFRPGDGRDHPVRLRRKFRRGRYRNERACLGPEFRALSHGHRVVAPSTNSVKGTPPNPLRDEDYTMNAVVNHIADFIAALGLSRVHIVGHSRGGFAATRVALQFPHLIESLTIVSSGTLSPRIALNEVVLSGQPFPSYTKESARWVYTGYCHDPATVTRNGSTARTRYKGFPISRRGVLKMYREGLMTRYWAPGLARDKRETHTWLQEGRFTAADSNHLGLDDTTRDRGRRVRCVRDRRCAQPPRRIDDVQSLRPFRLSRAPRALQHAARQLRRRSDPCMNSSPRFLNVEWDRDERHTRWIRIRYRGLSARRNTGGHTLRGRESSVGGNPRTIRRTLSVVAIDMLGSGLTAHPSRSPLKLPDMICARRRHARETRRDPISRDRSRSRRSGRAIAGNGGKRTGEFTQHRGEFLQHSHRRRVGGSDSRLSAGAAVRTGTVNGWVFDRLSSSTAHIDDALMDGAVRAADSDGVKKAVESMSSAEARAAFTASHVRIRRRNVARARDRGYPLPVQIIWGIDDPLTTVAHGHILLAAIGRKQIATHSIS